MSASCHRRMKNCVLKRHFFSFLNMLVLFGNDTVARPYDAVMLQFAVEFMRRRCQSMCRGVGGETCVTGGGLLERSLAGCAAKTKPWTIFSLHAWKSITQTPAVNARETDPTQRPLPLTTLHPPLLSYGPRNSAPSRVRTPLQISLLIIIIIIFLFLLLSFSLLQSTSEGYWEIALK